MNVNMCQLQTRKMWNNFVHEITTNIYDENDYCCTSICRESTAAKLVSVMLANYFRSSNFLELILEPEKQFFLYFFLVNTNIYQTIRCHFPEQSNFYSKFHDQPVFKIQLLSRIKPNLQ